MEAQSGLKHRLKRARGRQSVAVEHLLNSSMTQEPGGDPAVQVQGRAHTSSSHRLRGCWSLQCQAPEDKLRQGEKPAGTELAQANL